MSRIPPPTPPRTPLKSSKNTSSSILLPNSRSRAASPLTPASIPSRVRTKSTPKPPRNAKPPPAPPEDPSPSKPALSIREAIALKRAEAKKSAAKTGHVGGDGGLDDLSNLEDASPTTKKNEDEDIMDLGRWSLKECIERARSTGTINISTRSLPCIPSALFEIHLGITPDPLKSVEKEPPISTGTEDPVAPQRRKGGREAPAWFEAQDLQILKAWSNEIVEIQPEISLFGSIKTLDLHNNKIVALPETIADLSALTILDLSHNALESLPPNTFALPNLTTLNISHNALTRLPFNEPFSSKATRTNQTSGSFFAPVITRATSPLPRLLTLVAAHNNISASSIHYRAFPSSLMKLDLSGNPLATVAGLDEEVNECKAFLRSLGGLQRLTELRLEGCEIGDAAFSADLLTATPSSSTPPFPALHILDLGETKISTSTIKLALDGVNREISFDITADDLSATPYENKGVLKVMVGKKVVKEAWEIELERRAKTSGRTAVDVTAAGLEFGGVAITEIGQRSALERAQSKEKPEATPPPSQKGKEDWEIEAEQGLLTEGGKRRARAAAAMATSADAVNGGAPSSNERKVAPPPLKESWEIEAEQGLLTEGGRRRARAAAATAALESKKEVPIGGEQALQSSLTRYYAANVQTLTLPSSSPPPKNAGHSRALSLAVSSSFPSLQKDARSDLALPTSTLPLTEILNQSFAKNLRVLALVNRRMDRSFTLPALPVPIPEGYLPTLEELTLDGCGFTDTVPVSRQSATGSSSPPTRSCEPIIPLVTSLFPSLLTLDLSHNALSSSALSTDALSSLVFSTAHRRGLKHLRLRGNRLSDLAGFQGLALLFKGNRDVPEWKLEELDLRDNEIEKLPAELGLLALDIFLVDGNLFRVPQRRVWEREGTKGLLSWLRGRIE